MTCGDSRTTLKEFAENTNDKEPFDYFFVDGNHDFDYAYDDIVNGCALSEKGAGIAVDDCDDSDVRLAWIEAVKNGVVVEKNKGVCWVDTCFGACVVGVLSRAETFRLALAGRYGNGDDFEANKRMFSFFGQHGQNHESSVILIAGANKGQSMSNILEECPLMTVHGFEIQDSEFREAIAATQEYSNAVVHNFGWGEETLSGIAIGGFGALGGFYDPQGQRGFELSGETSNTVRLDEWASANIEERDPLFVIIDTEGYEPKIIRGMGLELIENRRRFSCFQYELGGTWAARDNRHMGDNWGQFETAVYLERLGYKLFMVGATNWLSITSEFFLVEDNPLILDEGFGPFIQRNALAIHPDFASSSLVSFIQNQG